jgi:hypothetical protein
VAERVAEGTRPDAYDYHEHPLREEIVDTLRRDDETVAVITRNRYGALVLNAASVFFADVDCPEHGPDGVLDAIVSAFSKARRQARQQAAASVTEQKIRDWSRHHPDRSLRLYRTFAGFRIMMTDRLYDPISQEVTALLRELDSDPLYRKLTEKQACFRARLTPKPWRCGWRSPPNRYPWNDANAEKVYRKWERSYHEKSQPYQVCELVEAIGPPAGDEPIGAVIDLHDRYACGGSDGKLA